MKKFPLIFFTALFTLGAGAASLMNAGSAVSLDKESSEEKIFLSYGGHFGDQCGLHLALLDDRGGFILSEALANIVVKVEDRQLKKNEEIVLSPRVSRASVYYDFPDAIAKADLYGVYASVATKDGSSLRSLSAGRGKLIVLSTPCADDQGR